MSVTKVSSPMIESGTKGADIASAATVVIGTDGSHFDITGSTGISTQFTVDAGRRFSLYFTGAVTITDNAAITLAGAANFTTAAGDILSFVATAANTVVQTGYSLVDGGSPVAPSGGIWELIQSHAVGDSETVASLDVTGLSTTAYHQYAIGLSRIRSVTDAVKGLLQLGDASGIDDGAGEYTWTTSWDQSDGTTHYVSVNNSDTSMRCIMDLGTATGEGGGAMMYLHSGEYTNVTKSVRPYISGTHTCMASNGYLRSGHFAGMRNGLIDVDRVKFFLTSGNIEAGRMTVWGIKHT